MTRTRFDNINCGVAQAVEQLGDGWTLLIVRDAILGATRFQQRIQTRENTRGHRS
jgi:DNA-binding HxlR family transcriptional regulator